MSGIYIQNMEMPTEGGWKTVRIYPDGTCAVPNWQGDCTFIKGAKAVPVPPHGRLIDADALAKSIKDQIELIKQFHNDDLDMIAQIIEVGYMQEIANAPTILEAEEGE